MRHLKAGNRLGKTPAHRKALMRNLATSLVEHGRITTTLAKAKALKPLADRLVTMAKNGSLHAKRQALKTLSSKESFIRLFGSYSNHFKEINGGYTRIYKIKNRLGDNSQMAIIEYLDYNSLSPSEEVEEPTKSETPVKKEEQRSDKSEQKLDNSVLSEVKKDFASEES